ncbi:STAS domain-containing protein [Tomitella biformata]|uniref:STAS domain-containing protein n=1 Tax=Tomitella biformata TaxID=630403 RepID=UPI000464E58A|nr:STAS domain-containing protein [Tomitella biformata]
MSDIRAHCALPRGATDVAVEIINRDGVAIASLSGAVDVLTVPAFSLALKHLLAQPQPCIVLDLTGIDFFGAVALRELINFGQIVSKPGVSWAVVGSRAVLRPLQLLGALGGLPVCGSVHSAIAHVSAK